MQTCHVRRIVQGNDAADDAAPIAALDAVSGVAQSCHQLRDDARHLLRAVATIFRMFREAKPRQRNGDDVEGILGAAAVFDGIGERSDDAVELVDRSGPPVRQRERHRVWHLRLLVDEVDLQAVDRRGELVELVQLSFLSPPVELVSPVLDEWLEIGGVSAVVPADVLQLIREARAREAFLQIAQDRVGHVDFERDNRLVGGPSLASDHRRCARRKQQGHNGTTHECPHGRECSARRSSQPRGTKVQAQSSSDVFTWRRRYPWRPLRGCP